MDTQHVGPKWGASGTGVPFTGTSSGAQRVADAHGRYYAPTIEKRIMTLDSGLVVIAAANVTASAMGTAKFINGFYNPVNSGQVAAILDVHVATVSGTPGGPFFWNFLPPGYVVNSAATGTILSNLINGAGSGSVMRPQVNVILTANPAIVTPLSQFGLIGGPAAVAAGAGSYDAAQEVAGRIIIPPGTLFGIMATAAGTTHNVHSTITWEEIPVS